MSTSVITGIDYHDIDPADPARYRMLAQIRVDDPGAVARAAQARTPFPGFDGRQFLIVAADHTARGVHSVGGRRGAMSDARVVLDHLLTALDTPGCTGVLASPDILDDLLLLGALDEKLVIGSVNRAGLDCASFEIDDRRTGHTPVGSSQLGLNGAKMLLRICYEDPATPARLEATAQLIDEFAALGLFAMVEPFITKWIDGRAVNQLDTESVIKAVAIASALGNSAAHSWLKIPVIESMEPVIAATTLPAVLLGGDNGESLDRLFARWGAALRLPGVVGLTVGRNLLFPENGDVRGAVAGAVGLLASR